MEKRKWIRPQLLVLYCSKSDEVVLMDCKTENLTGDVTSCNSKCDMFAPVDCINCSTYKLS
jgi:hypothetical protein